MQETVRWTVNVSKETDDSLRSYLGTAGVKRGGLSRFIEDAVRWRVFHQTFRDIKAQNTEIDPEELQRIVDEAVGEVRAERRLRRRSKKS